MPVYPGAPKSVTEPGIWQVSFALFGTWWLFRDVATIGGRAEPVDSSPFHQRRLGGYVTGRFAGTADQLGAMAVH